MKCLKGSKLTFVLAAFAVLLPVGTTIAASNIRPEDRLLIIDQTRNSGRRKHRRPRPKMKMMKQTRTAIAPGNWAGDGIKLEIGESSSSLQFACAEGAITEKLMSDSTGDFSAAGSYTKRSPGPQRDGGDAASKATFVGRVTGNTMTLKILLTESDTTVGEFSLELNKKIRLIRCL